MNIPLLFIHSAADRHVGYFQVFSYYEECCYKYLCRSFCVNIFSFIFIKYLGKELIWSCGHIFFKKLFKELSNCIPMWLYYFAFPQAITRVAMSRHLRQNLSLFLFDYSHLCGCEEVKKNDFTQNLLIQHFTDMKMTLYSWDRLCK